MAATNGAIPARQPHVPAWKRLGLKLKFAKDTFEPPSQTQQPQHSAPSPVSQTRTPPSDVKANDDRPSKKRKTFMESSRASPPNSRGHENRASLNSSSRLGNFEPSGGAVVRASVESEPFVNAVLDTSVTEDKIEDIPRSIPKRRKSVTFTEETKATDGNSAQSFSDQVSDAAAVNAHVSGSESSGTGKSPVKKAKKSKGEKSGPEGENSPKKRRTKPPQEPSETQAKPEYVKYLRQYHQERDSWKFNKNHQTALLKNAFNLDAVPSSLTPALVSYISGLQGKGPRQRLIETAVAILETFAAKEGSLDEIKAMNTQTGRKEAYYRALARELKKWEVAGMPRSEYDDGQLAKMHSEIEGGKRAEAILEILAAGGSLEEAKASIMSQPRTESTRQTNQDSSNSLQSQPKKKARKRKRRGDIDSDSSSSESDSDSDSSSTSTDDDDDENPVTTPNPPANTAPRTFSPAPATNSRAPRTTPAYQHDDFNMAYRPQNPSQLMNANVKPTKKFFDDDLLDAAFPKKKTYNDVAPKRRKEEKKGRFANTHGTGVDESGSEDDE